MAKIRFCTLFSGSSANCTYVEVNGNAVLIDAGAGVKKTEQALRQIGSGYDKIRGVFVTHEHSDHISGLKTILKYHTIPVIANPATISGFYGLSEFEKCFCSMPTGSCAENGDFRITSFSSSIKYVNSDDFLGADVKCSFGGIKIYLDNALIQRG